jgi:hypothetical protein
MKFLRFLALTTVLAAGTAAALMLTERGGWPRAVVIPAELAAMVVLCEAVDSRLRSRREILAAWSLPPLEPFGRPSASEVRRGLRAAAGLRREWSSDLDPAACRLCRAAVSCGDPSLSPEIEALLSVPRPVVQLTAAETLVKVGRREAVGVLRALALEPIDEVVAAGFRDAAERLHDRFPF